MEMNGQLHAPASLSPKKERYTLVRNVGGSQSQSEHDDK